MIRTKDDECDLDDGIYFQREEGVTGTTIQGWVREAVNDATSTSPEHRKKCIRVIYKGDYHIDLPVYYKPDKVDHPLLTVKNQECEESDPKYFIDWFRKQKDEEGQLVRTIKYLKSWCDHKRNKMPSGLAMTVLAEKNMTFNDLDDVALHDTLVKIKSSLEISFSCVMPTTPNDDLFADYDSSRTDNFLDNLDDFIEGAKRALDELNQLKASKLWRRHLGERFPLGLDEELDSKEQMLKNTAGIILVNKAFTNRSGIIQQTEGVKHDPHKNYGG